MPLHNYGDEGIDRVSVGYVSLFDTWYYLSIILK